MVDFKKALEAKKLVVQCQGTQNPCTNEATCWFEFHEVENPENKGEACLCEKCFKDLFPNATNESIEEVKFDMLAYKYRKLIKE